MLEKIESVNVFTHQDLIKTINRMIDVINKQEHQIIYLTTLIGKNQYVEVTPNKLGKLIVTKVLTEEEYSKGKHSPDCPALKGKPVCTCEQLQRHG